MISLREFFKGVSGAVAAARAIPPLLTWATDDSSVQIPDPEGMIVRSARFLDLEKPSGVSYFLDHSDSALLRS